MADETNKLASEVPSILHAGAQHLRKMAQVNVDLTYQKEALEHEVRVMKLARRMEQRGLQSTLSFEEKVAAMQDFDTEKLAHTEQAIEIAAGGFSLGRVQTEEENAEPKTAAAQGENYSSTKAHDALDMFVLSGQALG